MNNYVTGLLKVGNNFSINCYVLGFLNTLVHNTCANNTPSDATLTTGVTTAGSFVNSATGDYSLNSADTVIRGVLALPTGDDTLTHTWSDANTTDLLRNAVEIQGDGIGNDNNLCESDEDCLYTPNMAAYQGHGNLISADYIGYGDTLENITLWKYETNGY